jgi:peptidyl-dipeptidase A
MSLGLVTGCADSGTPEVTEEDAQLAEQTEAAQFIDTYVSNAQHLFSAWQQADWEASTQMGTRQAALARASTEAQREYEQYVSSTEVTDKVADLMGNERLDELTMRVLERIEAVAGRYPAQGAVDYREIEELTLIQVGELRDFEYRLDGEPVSKSSLEDSLLRSTNIADRRLAWNALKAPGGPLKPGVGVLRDRRNALAQSLGHSDHFARVLAGQDMTSEELLAWSDDVNEALRPLYRELHTWTRYELARQYRKPVPDQIPVHWLTETFGDDWSAIHEGGRLDYRYGLSVKTGEEMMKEAEAFFVSMGFDAMPGTFWGRSSPYASMASDRFQKRGGASAWHMDLNHDVRLLMNVESDMHWHRVIHEQFGVAQYFLAYANPSVPVPLRDAPGGAFHQAIGSLFGHAATRPGFLEARGLLIEEPSPLTDEAEDGEAVEELVAVEGQEAEEGGEAVAEVAVEEAFDEMALLLEEALDYVVFVPFALGTVTQFEHNVYAGNLSVDQMNTRWWQLALEYQGIEAPETRTERYGDPFTKAGLHIEPASYFRHAQASLLMFQLNQHVAGEILGEESHLANYWGSAEAGEFLRSIMASGATKDWQTMVSAATGEPLSADAMVNYFEPLMDYLVKLNEGRTYTLSEIEGNL